VVRLAETQEAANGATYPSFRDIRGVAERMEEAGFDSLWVFDHLLYHETAEQPTGIWEGWTMLSALAAVTQRIELGPLVACTHFRNPAVLAKMAATLDEVSNGRLILGLGAGWNQPEFEAFGIPFNHRLKRFEEALQIVVPLLREGQVDFEGQYYQAQNAQLIPCGPRPAGPPILIGGWGPRMLELSVRYAAIWNGGYSGSFDTFRERLDRFEVARSDAGETASEVQASALLKLGWPDLAEIPAFFEGEYVTGSADEIAQAFKEYADAGVSHVMCQYHPYTLEALERLIGALHAYREL
jgi:probable F420-dependent oxidoreductase